MPSILGNHQGAGFANFPSQQAAAAFAKQLSDTVTKYGLSPAAVQIAATSTSTAAGLAQRTVTEGYGVYPTYNLGAVRLGPQQQVEIR